MRLCGDIVGGGSRRRVDEGEDGAGNKDRRVDGEDDRLEGCGQEWLSPLCHGRGTRTRG